MAQKLPKLSVAPFSVVGLAEDFEHVDCAAVQAVSDRALQAVNDCLSELESLTGRRYAFSGFVFAPDGDDAYGVYTLPDPEIPRTKGLR